MLYDFMTMGETFTLELTIEINDEIDTFKVNGESYYSEGTIVVKIEYNQKNKNN